MTPKLLDDLIMEDKSVFYWSFMWQLYLSCSAVMAESFLLVVMAYNFFMAICNPLLYPVTMSRRLCALLVTGSYFCAMFCPSVFLCYALQLSFTGFNVINHFLLLLGFATFNEVSTLLIILTSYMFIFVTVIKAPSASGHCKAFSTCASHLTAITIFHSTIPSLYCVPNSKNSRHRVKMASMFYAIVNPILNPLIYSLRNKDVMDAFQKVVDTKVPLH
ncbi:Olfactory receptor 5D14 [Heterocephalus glaber]|uniref:Olfactory receptor 5D14 n=1 Tax=Heterocephalus glaber TaxID=10181 RepID=G5C165_HETGA|nr:Olfactory receptor 5D14 [Heterocephalus glaber]